MSIQRISHDLSIQIVAQTLAAAQALVSQVAQEAIASTGSVELVVQSPLTLAQVISLAAINKSEEFQRRGDHWLTDCRRCEAFKDLVPWIEKKEAVAQETVMAALKEAIQLKKYSIFYYLLGYGPLLTADCYRYLLKIAIEKACSREVEFLLSNGVRLPQTYLAVQVRQLVLNKDYLTAPFILKYLKAPFVGIDEMVIMASAMHLGERVIDLLSQTCITITTRDAALSRTHVPKLIRCLQEARIGEPKSLIYPDHEVHQPREFLLTAKLQEIPEYQAISDWLRGGDFPGEEDFQSARLHSAVAMPSDVVRFLVSATSTIHEHDLAEMVIYAASFGRLSTVRYLLSEGRVLLADQLFRAAKSSVNSGQVEITRFLIAEGGEFSQENIDAIFYAASCGSMLRRGFPEVLSALFSMGKKPSQNCLGNAVASAAANFSIEVIQILLSDGRTLRQDQIKKAISRALVNNNPELLRLILSEGRILIQEDLGSMFVEAVRSNFLVSARFFITEGWSLHPYHLITAMRHAARQNNDQMIREMLHLGLVTHQNMLGSVVESAVAAGNIVIARWLLTQIHGHFDRRAEVLILAARMNLSGIVEDLLLRGPIDQSVRDSSISVTSCQIIRDLLLTVTYIPHPASMIDQRQSLEQQVDRQQLTLSLTELRLRPERWLQHVAGRGLPSRVCFSEFPHTIDLGGVIKQFISTLCDGLIEKNIFSRQTSGLMTCNSDREAICLQQFGKFLSDIDRKNHRRSEKFLIGRMCHPRYFEFAVIAKQEKSQEAILQDCARLLMVCDPMQELVAHIVLNPTLENCKQLQAVLLCDVGQEVIEAKSIVASYLRAACEIYNGASFQFQLLMLADPVGTLFSIQGEEASAESVLKALTFHGQSEREAMQFIWIREEIATASQEFRKKFLRAITGKTSLAPADKIQVKQTWRDGGFFEIHTCFNMLELPKIDLTKKQFIDALKSCLDDHYNIA